jgi:hypothetical protein
MLSGEYPENPSFGWVSGSVVRLDMLVNFLIPTPPDDRLPKCSHGLALCFKQEHTKTAAVVAALCNVPITIEASSAPLSLTIGKQGTVKGYGAFAGFLQALQSSSCRLL